MLMVDCFLDRKLRSVTIHCRKSYEPSSRKRRHRGVEPAGTWGWSWYSDYCKHVISWYPWFLPSPLRWPFLILSTFVLEDQGALLKIDGKCHMLGWNDLERPWRPWMTRLRPATWMIWMVGAMILGRWRFVHPVQRLHKAAEKMVWVINPTNWNRPTTHFLDPCRGISSRCS